MPLLISEGNRAKLAEWSHKHNMSQNRLVNLILSAVDELVLEDTVVEIRRKSIPHPRSTKVRKIGTID